MHGGFDCQRRSGKDERKSSRVRAVLYTKKKLEAEEQANLLYIVCLAKHGEAMIDHHCAMIATLP